MNNNESYLLRAIRKKCIECSGMSYTEVRECPIIDCPLYEYRMGKRIVITRKEKE